MVDFNYYNVTIPPGVDPTKTPLGSMATRVKPSTGATATSPAVSAQAPAPSLALTPSKLFAAAFDVGYGLPQSWSTVFTSSAAEQKQLFRSLRRRTQWLVGLLEITAGGTLAARSCVSHLETSDMAVVSYQWGQIAARLAASAWLGALPMRFLHKSVYADTALMHHPITLSGSANPDYLVGVGGASSTWHVMEAKGGWHRSNRVRPGLAQVLHAGAINDGTQLTVPSTRLVAYIPVKKKASPQLAWGVEVYHVPSPLPIANAPTPSGHGAMAPLAAKADANLAQGAPSLAFDAQVAELTAVLVQFRMLSELDFDAAEMTAMSVERTADGPSVRRTGAAAVAVWLPPRQDFDAFAFPLLLYRAARSAVEHLSGTDIPALHAVELVEQVADRCDCVVSAAMRDTVGQALQEALIQVAGESALSRVFAALDLDGRYAVFREAREGYMQRAHHGFRARRLAAGLVMARQEAKPLEHASSLCGAVFYDCSSQVGAEAV